MKLFRDTLVAILGKDSGHLSLTTFTNGLGGHPKRSVGSWDSSDSSISRGLEVRGQDIVAGAWEVDILTDTKACSRRGLVWCALLGGGMYFAIQLQHRYSAAR